MKKLLVFYLVSCVALMISATPKQARKPVKIHVPPTLEGVKLIDPAAAKVGHVLLVNVGNAVPAADWPRISTFASTRMQINIWTNSVAKTPLPEIMKDPSSFNRIFGKNAKVGVFLVDNDEPFPVIAAPGAWARVNVNFLKKDNPDAVTYADRVAKMILKGIVAAAGAGSSMDSRSANNTDTFDLEGIDKRDIIITPDVYFPMLETLRIVGGDDLISPAFTESNE